MVALAACPSLPVPARAVDPVPGLAWPLLSVTIPVDRSVPADDHVEQRLSLDAHLVRIPEATFLLRVTGEALAEAGIHDGDLLVMDRALPATEGSLALALIDAEFLLVRVGRDAQGQRQLYAKTPQSGERMLGDEAVTMGVARWVVHRLWPGRAAPH